MRDPIARFGCTTYDTTRNIAWLADLDYAVTRYAISDGPQGDADG